MKIGIDAPWYKDPVERVAFNLYAMEQDNLRAIAQDILMNHPDEDLDDLREEYELNDLETKMVYNIMKELTR